MKTTRSSDGTRIAFEATGAGPALVLVSGALSDRATAAPLRPLLDPHFTVVAYDRRGRGDSGDTAPYAPAREVEDLAAVIEAAGSPAFVFGQSSGGILALNAAIGGLPIARLAVNEPPYVLENTRPPIAPDVTARLQAAVAAGDREGALRTFLRDQVGLDDATLERLRATPMWTRMLALAHTAPYDAAVAGASTLPAASLAAISTRTLVTRCGASFPWIGATARAVAALLPDAELVTLEGQPHAPAADVLAPALVKFFLA